MGATIFTLRGTFRRKSDATPYVPMYMGQEYDKSNLKSDFRNVGHDITSAMEMAKTKWYGKKS